MQQQLEQPRKEEKATGGVAVEGNPAPTMGLNMGCWFIM
jgi:hypothetical protein